MDLIWGIESMEKELAKTHSPASNIMSICTEVLKQVDELITKPLKVTDSEYYTEKEVSDMDIMGDNFREYLYGWDDAFVQGKGYLKKYVDMYLTHIHKRLMRRTH